MKRPKDPAKVQEKRKVHNRQKMFSFFSQANQYGQPRHGLLEQLEPHQVLWLLKAFIENEASMHAFEKYARSHKLAVSQLNEDDIKAVQELIFIRSIQES